jgi:hypothetical protein
MLLGKDQLKETLHDVLSDPGQSVDRAWSRRLGGTTLELLWALAADAPAVVLEANFRPCSDYERDRITSLGGRLVEVYCACPAELASRRYAARGGLRPVRRSGSEPGDQVRLTWWRADFGGLGVSHS